MEGLVGLAVIVLLIIPMLKLLPHFGINKYWALVCVFPVVGVLVLVWWMSIKLQELERR
ncbi:MAG: hypothetical protein AAF999_03530 [Pseudomonadota bacterium]